jgi:head-tail adaptor
VLVSAPGRKGPLTASDLKHRATLQDGSISTDSMGGRTEVWNAFATRVAASADPQPFIVNEKEASVLYLVRIRYRSDVILDGGSGACCICKGMTRTRSR